jgi:hypothetical protein
MAKTFFETKLRGGGGGLEIKKIQSLFFKARGEQIHGRFFSEFQRVPEALRALFAKMVPIEVPVANGVDS